MKLETLRDYLLQKKGTTEEMPFGPEVLVFKVLGKMFALVSWQATPLKISLKCDPMEALFLRDVYTAVTPGYHLDKRHWNTITLDGSVPEAELRRMMDDSYILVVQRLKKAERDTLLL
ncbi:MAG: MmcQ/YjbR family DNA-binding protein [Ardenticatenaceae bacterium]|nr:MmcQ/YjbR family DNA-binding protein [Ardenticatenaceae bacterium]MCB8988340.1 MmcQ/YjbR family DNA-binding protein [Ardenticatenaceae bacterium]